MFMKARPAETYENFMKIIGYCGDVIGVNIVVPNYRINWRTYILFFSIIIYFSFSIYTIRVLDKEDWVHILGVIITSCSGLSGSTKLWSVICDAKGYYEIYKTMLDIYKNHQEIDKRYEQVLQNGCKRLRNAFGLVGLVYLQVVVLAAALPLLNMKFGDGNRYMIVFTQLPGFDVSTDFGYWSTFITHEVWIIMACLGLYSGDIVIVTCLINSQLFFDVLSLKINDLNEVIDRQMEKNKNEKNITEMLNDVVAWHQAYCRFTDKCNDIFFWIITVQISCSTASIILTLYIIFTSSWPGAYANLLYGFTSLYEYCLLGTKVEICNDQFCDEIYNIHWYGLSISQQKTVRLMLMRAQSPHMINIAGVMPMTVNTALGITRNIYSTFTMLLQFQ